MSGSRVLPVEERQHPVTEGAGPELAIPAQPAPRGGLDKPPADVERMLERYGTSLPRYLDRQRQRDIERSRQRWPALHPARRPETEETP